MRGRLSRYFNFVKLSSTSLVMFRMFTVEEAASCFMLRINLNYLSWLNATYKHALSL